MAGTRDYRSIGEVLVAVKTEFPDITISKIRFLEAEGLIDPERTPSGYRKFYDGDVDRLKAILRMQRDEYLPLKVIKDRLDGRGTASDEVDGRGGAPSGNGAGSSSSEMALPADEVIAEPPAGLQMSLEEMASATGLDRERIQELESYGIICSHGPDGARYYDGDDYVTLSVVKDFFAFGGIEPRHLKMYKNFNDREADLFGTLVAPTLRQRNPEARRMARETLDELAATSRRFKQALLRASLREYLGDRPA